MELGVAKVRYKVRNMEDNKKIGFVEYEGYNNKSIKIDGEKESNRRCERKTSI